MPWCAARRMPLMAYSPIGEGRLLHHHTLVEIARRHDVSPAQIALSWTMRQPGIIAIPKAGNVTHVEDNFRSLSIHLTEEDLHDLDTAFPAPARKIPWQVDNNRNCYKFRTIIRKMNKVIDSMLAHRSIRSYTDRTVSDEDLNSIIRAVQAAPNWVNLQLVSIIAVKNTDHRRRLAELCGNQVHIAEAPVFLVFCTDYHRVALACHKKEQTLDEVMQDIDTLLVGAHEVGIALEAAVVAPNHWDWEQSLLEMYVKMRWKLSMNCNFRNMSFLCWDYVSATPQKNRD